MVIFFLRCDGDILFSTTMRYRLFLDNPYNRHRCDYFSKQSESIILRFFYNLCLRGLRGLRDLRGFREFRGLSGLRFLRGLIGLWVLRGLKGLRSFRVRVF